MLNDSVTRESMATLRPKTWLNDEIINACMSCLAKRNQEHSPCSRMHFFSSHFMDKLVSKTGHNYSNVRRWSNKVNNKYMFSLTNVFIPMSTSKTHWTCAAVYFKLKEIRHCDSLRVNGHVCTNSLLNHLKDE